MDQRRLFVAQALDPSRCETFSALCARYRVSRKTGYKWLDRYRAVGTLADLVEGSRRPHRSPRRTTDAVTERLVELRQRYGWGGKKLRVLLAREGIELPRRTADRIIQRRGLVRPEHRRQPATTRFERSHPNELWQMDFKGQYPVKGGRECFPLAILDDHSRYAVGLFALTGTALEPVLACLIVCFERSGVPLEMVMDHGVPWWSNSNGWGLTRLSVFLINQGIALIYGTVGHAETRGKIERFNGTMDRALLHRGVPQDLPSFQPALDDYRWEYNHVRPHEALGLDVPAARYTPSPRTYQPNPPVWDYPAHADVRKLNTQGFVTWGRRRYFVCEALAEQWVWCQPFEERVLVTYRHMHVREIDLRTGNTKALVCRVGRLKADLTGSEANRGLARSSESSSEADTHTEVSPGFDPSSDPTETPLTRLQGPYRP